MFSTFDPRRSGAAWLRNTFGSYRALLRELSARADAGLCVVCGDRAVPGERFCAHHQLEQSAAP